MHARRARLRRPAVPTIAAAALALAAAAIAAAIAAAAIAAAAFPVAFPARPGTAPVLPPREFNRSPCAHRCVVNH